MSNEVLSPVAQIDFEQRFGIGSDGRKDFVQELFADLNDNQPVVQCIVFKNIGEETRNDHAESVVENGPSGVLT